MAVRPGRRGLLWAAMALGAALLLGLPAIWPTSAQERDPIVFAAASLRNALDEVAAAYRAETGRAVRVSYAASSALARQIEAGAPADLFLSADRDWMDHLEKRGLIRAGTRADLLTNRLVLIAPKDSPVRAAIAPGFPLAALLGEGRLAMADASAVPAGKYGRAALQALGVWDSVEGRIAQADNVRAALALVSRGEAPLGIVYQTDAIAEPKVRILDSFPEDSHPRIVYPVALTTQAEEMGGADLLVFLKSREAEAAFRRHGFTVLAQ